MPPSENALHSGVIISHVFLFLLSSLILSQLGKNGNPLLKGLLNYGYFIKSQIKSHMILKEVNHLESVFRKGHLNRHLDNQPVCTLTSTTNRV